MTNKSSCRMFLRHRTTARTEGCCCATWLNFVLLTAALANSPNAFASAPPWLRAAAQTPLSKYTDDTDAVLLLSEQITTVTDAGEIKTLYRRAYKVLRPGGRDRGVVAVYFDDETRLTELKAWCLPAAGKEYEVKQKDAIETSAFTESLYQDTRYLILKIPAADPGNVVGYEYEQRRRPSILQDTWEFQHDVPVRRARFELRLPPGWEYEPFWLNHPTQNPQQIGDNRWAWDIEDIPAVEEEASMPAWQALAGRMEVTYYPRRANGGHPSQASWRDVGLWYAHLAADRRRPSAEIQQRVAELTSTAPTTLGKVRALASFVQKDIRYVAIEIGIGGYQPHSAQDTFINRYGDCKDKATLLSTMLGEIGVKSYYVLVNTKRGVIAPEFPSMLGFNHVILAIRLPAEPAESSSLWSVQDHKQLGRLLYFDPTSTLVGIGYLPETLQESYGMIVAETGGELVKLPLLPPSVNRLLRTAKLVLTPEGTLTGDVKEIRWGSPAADLRAQLLNASQADRQKVLENFLGSFLSGVVLQEADVADLDKIDATLVVHYRFVAPNYAKAAGDLLLVRPRVLGEKVENVFEMHNGKERRYPVEFPAASLQGDLIEIALPAGYNVDELPPPSHEDAGIVAYQSKAEVSGNVLHYNRLYQIKDVIVPAARFDELRQFYRQVASDESSSAVLKRIVQ
jgi:hypothetical protein